MRPTRSGPRGHSSWPSGFYWGTATAGYQVEGDAPDSNWRRYVDRTVGKPGPFGIGSVDPYEEADDFRHRYRDDIANAHAMGINTFRFSVEWARVMPQPGQWDERELAYYDDIVATLRRNGMTPMITLMHFAYPGWVVDRGGFMNAIGAFDEFAAAITKRYAGQGVLWVSINEPFAFAALEIAMGAITPDDWEPFLDRVAQAHRAVYRAAHDADPDAKVTSNEGYEPPSRSVRSDETNADISRESFFDRIKDSVDYLGFDYYTGTASDNPASKQNPSAPWDIKLQPEDIYYVCRYYAQRYPGLPIYVVENGMVTDNAKPRRDSADAGAALDRHRVLVAACQG